MRLRRLSLKGITRFADEVAIDFEALGPGLVAIAGANGAGKTSILESPFAALHLEYPTRPGGLCGVAHGKDARLELEVDGYRALVAIDAVRSTSEAYLFNGTGEPVNPSGKLREYTAAIAERFGSPRLMLSAALSCQTKRGSFLDLSKAERKDLLAEILDTAGLQALAERARERAKSAELSLERARGAVAAAERELAGLPEHDLGALQLAVAQAGETLTMLRARLEAARERYTTLEAERRQVGERIAAVQRIREQRDEGLRQVAAANHRMVQLDQEERAAVESAARQRQQLATQAARLPELEQAERALVELRAELATFEQCVAVARTTLEEARAEHERWQAQERQAERTELALAGAQRQAELLGQVPCTYGPWVAHGNIGFAAKGVPESSAVDLAGTCPLLANARAASASAEQLADQAQALVHVPLRLAEAAERWRHADAELQRVVQQLEERRADERALSTRAAGVQAARLAASQLEALATQEAETLAGMDRRRQVLRRELAEAEKRQQKLQAEVEATPLPDASQIDTQLAKAAAEGRELRAAVAGAEGAAVAADRQLVKAEADVARRATLEEQLAGDRTSLATLGADLADWRTLERAFGRDGIQALEIDAAGPELSSLTNELLGSCFGPRFEVAFVTQVLKADGKGSKEVFDVQVIDHDRGREGAVDSLSGGEKTIVSEAISLALAIYVGRHSGRRFETLFRDETAGQLDPDNAQRYVSMLRRARVLAGAHQVVYIAQQPEVWSQADAVLWCEGGRVEVRA